MFGWEVVIPVEQRVAGLADIIAREEGEAVLAWIVGGAMRWREAGLLVTEAMLAKVETWRGEEDIVGAFLTEKVVEADEDSWISNVELFGVWKAWAEARGLQAGSADSLGRRLAERGYKRVRKVHNTVRGFGGLAWREVAAGEVGDGLEFEG